MVDIPPTVLNLVERFSRDSAAYQAPGYNETQLRREFLDPFFAALGWDVVNTSGYADLYKDVIHEDAIRVGGAVKAPDYCFRIGGLRKFFLEAKRPAVNLKDDPSPAYQLRRYAWSAKLSISALSNFAQFAIYDTRFKPNVADKASQGRIFYCTFDEYPTKWPQIASILAKQSILTGAFDKFAESTKAKRGTAEVDQAFLNEIEGWRKDIAENLALRNPTLTQRDLNAAVTRTIDRIIFLRICEDRGIEIYGQLQTLSKVNGVYGELLAVFRRADAKYNSGLFHFVKEKDRPEEHDDLTPGLQIDDAILKPILASLYYPESPYEFSVLPADILGHVYEQFLGKVIRLTVNHRAKVEEKPEVRKAGGVFYTPTYIVDYIVQNTVGKLVDGKTPGEIAKIKILDPACGSGSFLLGVYQFLLDWHLHYFVGKKPDQFLKQKIPPIYETASNSPEHRSFRLTTARKKEILLNNIFGVDIDPNAVETTKLSLLLKVLEGESQESIDNQMRLFRQRALPDLADNIKCGNSLVALDFYSNQQLSLLDEQVRYKVNAFDWETEFSLVMKSGGFDAVIGNPPYSYRNATEAMLRPYYLNKYNSVQGNFDLYKLFLEKALHLLRSDGFLGMIVSASFLVLPSYSKLREILLTSSIMERLAPLGPGVFKGATVDTAVLIARKGSAARGHRVLIQAPAIPTQLPHQPVEPIRQSRFAGNAGAVFDYRLGEKASPILKRLIRSFPKIESGFELGVGINTGYIRDELVADYQVDCRYHPMVPGSGISRFGPVRTQGWIMYDRDFVQRRGKLGRTLPDRHLLDNPKLLVVRTRNLALHRRIIATLDDTQAYNLNRLSNIIARDGFSLHGLLAIINSTLFNWLFSTRFFDYEIKPIYIRQCPLADCNNRELVTLAESMLMLTKRVAFVKTGREQIIRQINGIDRQIDQIVYELYELKPDEIKIIADTCPKNDE